MKFIFRKVALLFVLVFVNCETESFDSAMETSNMEITFQELVIQNFTWDAFISTGTVAKENLEVLWEKSETYEIEGKIWNEFEIKDNLEVSLQEGRVRNTSYVLLVTETSESMPVYYITRFSSYNDHKQKSYFNLEKDYFNGMVHMYDLEGNILIMQYLSKGEILNTSIDVDNENPNLFPGTARCTQKIASKECLSTNGCIPPVAGGGGCGGSGLGGRYVFMRTGYNYRDWWLPRGNGVYEYSHPERLGAIYEYVWVQSGRSIPPLQNSLSHYGYNGESGSYLSSKPRKTTPTRINVDGVTNPCVKKLIAKLRAKDVNKLVSPNIKALQGSNHLSQTILDMFAGSADYNLSFKIADATTSNGSKRNAYTQPRPNTPTRGKVTFDIVLDKNYVKNATALAIARTIIHESLHAYLSYSTHNYSSAPFTQLFNNYVSTKGYSTNTAQHNMMTQFADAMGKSLAIFDSNKQSQSYYSNLAWSGDMLKTTAFGQLSSTRQKAIRDANMNEGNAVNSANGKAKGVKCL